MFVQLAAVFVFLCAAWCNTGTAVDTTDNWIFFRRRPIDALSEVANSRNAPIPRSALELQPSRDLTLRSRIAPRYLQGWNVPSSAKVGETVLLQVNTENGRLNSGLPITYKISSNKKYEVLNGSSQQFCIAPSGTEAATFRLRAVEEGDVSITVSSTTAPTKNCTGGASGISVTSERRNIKFELPGLPKKKTYTKYICDGDDVVSWNLQTPANTTIVETSVRVSVTVTGSLVGLALGNMEDLIQLPQGCGEQNMLSLASSASLGQYLKQTGRLTKAWKKKLRSNVNAGYEKQLEYRHSDGSFSVFGAQNTSGSTWLTAYVLKNVALAGSYIASNTNLTAAADLIDAGKRWLLGRQNLTSGCFRSEEGFIHDGIKGNKGDGAGAVAAFVMIALLEAGGVSTDASVGVSHAAACVDAATADGTPGANDTYLLALKAYAYALAGSPRAADAAGRLLKKLSHDGNYSYFAMSKSKASANDALTVETTGYGLLALLKIYGDTLYPVTHRILKFLVSKMNSHGGLVSSQDTVVALQAMTLFETTPSQSSPNLTVTLTGDGLNETFSIVANDSLITSSVNVSQVPNDIVVEVEGDGCAVVQAVVSYNSESAEESTALNLDVTTTSRNCSEKNFTACVSYAQIGDEESNMAIIEVHMVSGYEPSIEDLEEISACTQNNIKLYETKGRQIIFYVESLNASQTCISFRVFRESGVENARNGIVVVYDYYEPELYVSKAFEFDSSSCSP